MEEPEHVGCRVDDAELKAERTASRRRGHGRRIDAPAVGRSSQAARWARVELRTRRRPTDADVGLARRDLRRVADSGEKECHKEKDTSSAGTWPLSGAGPGRANSVCCFAGLSRTS